MTNHKFEIDILRGNGDYVDGLAADLLELHDKTGISLDNWENARKFVEFRVNMRRSARDFKITPNGV